MTTAQFFLFLLGAAIVNSLIVISVAEYIEQNEKDEDERSRVYRQ